MNNLTVVSMLWHPSRNTITLLKFGESVIQFLQLLSALLFDLLFRKRDLPEQFTLLDQKLFFFACHFRVHSIHPVRLVDRRKNRLQTVIVILPNRIPLMLMTTGTLDRGGTKTVEDIGYHIIPIQITCHFTISLGFRYFHMPDKIPWPSC